MKFSKYKHTRGPWTIGSSDLPVVSLSIHGETGGAHSTLARIADAGLGAEECLANARLMSAAEELFDVAISVEVDAEPCKDQYGNDAMCISVELFNSIKKAIIKATGA